MNWQRALQAAMKTSSRFDFLRVRLSLMVAGAAGVLTWSIAMVLIPEGKFSPFFMLPFNFMSQMTGSVLYNVVCRLPAYLVPSSIIPALSSSTVGNLNDVLQVVTIAVCGTTCWWTYRRFSYLREDISNAEKAAEPFANQRWKRDSYVPKELPTHPVSQLLYFSMAWFDKRINWQFVAKISNLIIRAVITWVTIFLINALLVLLGINIRVDSRAVQVGIVVLYGVFLGYAVTYVFVGLDDWEFVVVYLLFGLGAYALLWLASTCGFNIYELRIADSPLVVRVTQIHADFFQLGRRTGFSTPPAVSFFGTNLGTSAMFTILILVFGLFNLILTRDAVNDWWWVRTQARIQEEQGAQFDTHAECFITLLRTATSFTIFASALVAIFPASHTPLTWATYLHMIGGYGLVIALIALMGATPLLLSGSLPKQSPTSCIKVNSYDIGWFKPFSWGLLIIGILTVVWLVLGKPFRAVDGSSFEFVMAVEVVAFPINVIWISGLNFLTKNHLATLTIPEAAEQASPAPSEGQAAA